MILSEKASYSTEFASCAVLRSQKYVTKIKYKNMKKTFILLLLNISLFSAFSQGYHQHGDSRLYLKMRDNSSFFAKIDGRTYDTHTDRLRINSIDAGWHRLMVYEKNGPHGQTRIVYRGRIEIPRASKVFAVVGGYNDLIIKRIEPINSNNYPPDNNNYNPVSLNMQQLTYTLNGTSFESDKLIIAKQAVSTNGVYADQVLQIMQNFSFESTKLDFAKFAYAYCADKNNYFSINSGFSFNSSIIDLNNFVASQGNSGNYNNNNYNFNDNNNHNNTNDDETGGDW